MAEALKHLYSQGYIEHLCTQVLRVEPGFDATGFKQTLFDAQWEARELKERMHHIAKSLHGVLGGNYRQNLPVLTQVFELMGEGYALENMLFQDIVELYGLDDVEESLAALRHFTIGSSSEFAIRAFIKKYPQQTMEQMMLWAEDENEHVRRLASEGSRPRLPWACALPEFKNDPSHVIPILEKLKDDPSAYVRKSVANNLNDISKDHPERFKFLLKAWIGYNEQRDRMLKHAARTLLKAADAEVMACFGYAPVEGLSVHDFKAPDEVSMGEELSFAFGLKAPGSLGRLRVEYALHFVRQKGRFSAKVFKLSEGVVAESMKDFSKTYSFKAITTRKYYAGEHSLSIIVNGVNVHQHSFTLSDSGE